MQRLSSTTANPEMHSLLSETDNPFSIEINHPEKFDIVLQDHESLNAWWGLK